MNADTGPMGAQVAGSVRDEDGFEWHVVPAEAATTRDYAVVITLPADLTASMATLAELQPRRAALTVATNPAADADRVDSVIATVVHHIEAAGVEVALAAAAHARSEMSAVQVTAQLLDVGVDSAVAGARQFTNGAEQLQGFLDMAEDGAAELTSALTLLKSTVDGAATQAEHLATALDSTDLTLAHIEQSAHTITRGMDHVLPILHSLPATDPPLRDALTELQAIRDVSAQVDTQLTGLGSLVGGVLDPNTDLGTLLRTVVIRLSDASDKLSEGARLAETVPLLAERGGTSLREAITMINEGLATLQHSTGLLGTQTDKAMAAFPRHSADQQSAIALALTDPIDVVRE